MSTRTVDVVDVDDKRSFVRLLGKVTRDLAALAKVMPRLIERADIPADADGYPTAASGAQRDGSGGSMPAPTVERIGDRHRWTCGVRGCTVHGWSTNDTWAHTAAAAHYANDHGASIDYADPTGTAATTSGHRPDPVNATVRSIWYRVRRAADELALAGEMARNLTTPRDVATPDDDDIWCVRHARIGLLEQVAFHRDGRRKYRNLCKRCGEFRAAWGVDIPDDLLRLRETRPDRRITKAETELALAKDLADRQEANRRKKAKKGKKR